MSDIYRSVPDPNLMSCIRPRRHQNRLGNDWPSGRIEIMPSDNKGTKMKRAITLSAMMVGLFGAIPAAAQTPEEVDARYSREYSRCMDTSQTTSDTVNCQLAEIDIHDAKLNNIYKIKMSKLTNKYKLKLRNSQREWIKHRDSTCKNEAKIEEGGSFWTILYNLCIARETIKRLIWLERYKIR